MDQFAREIAGALKATIDVHGPITEARIASATKRIAHALREEMKRERDRMVKTQPRDAIERPAGALPLLSHPACGLRFRDRVYAPIRIGMDLERSMPQFPDPRRTFQIATLSRKPTVDVAFALHIEEVHR